MHSLTVCFNFRRQPRGSFNRHQEEQTNKKNETQKTSHLLLQTFHTNSTMTNNVVSCCSRQFIYNLLYVFIGQQKKACYHAGIYNKLFTVICFFPFRTFGGKNNKKTCVLFVSTCCGKNKHICVKYQNFLASYTRIKRGTLHVPNLMLMSKIFCSCSLALDSAHVKFDVSIGR